MLHQQLQNCLRVYLCLLAEGQADNTLTHIYATDFQYSAQALKRCQTPEHFHLRRRIAEAVDNFVQKILTLRIFQLAEATIQLHFITRIRNIAVRNIGLCLNFQNRLRLRLSLLAVFQAFNSFFQHLAICGKAYAGNMSVLLWSQQIAGTADFQVTHSNLKACAQLRKITDGLQTLFGNFTQRLIRLINKVSISKTRAASYTATHLVEL